MIKRDFDSACLSVLYDPRIYAFGFQVLFLSKNFVSGYRINADRTVYYNSVYVIDFEAKNLVIKNNAEAVISSKQMKKYGSTRS